MLVKEPRARFAFESAAAAWAAQRVNIATVVQEYHQVIDGTVERITTSPPFRLAQLLAQPSIAEANAIAMDHVAALENPEGDRFVGRLWWAEGLLPAPRSQQKVRLSGPSDVATLVKRLTGRCEPVKRDEIADCGVFVGSWGEASKHGTRLAAFCDGFAENGLATFAFWDSEARDDDPLTPERAAQLLADFDFEVLHMISRPSTPLIAVSRFRPVIEIAAVARRAVASRLDFDARR